MQPAAVTVDPLASDSCAAPGSASEAFELAWATNAQPLEDKAGSERPTRPGIASTKSAEKERASRTAVYHAAETGVCSVMSG